MESMEGLEKFKDEYLSPSADRRVDQRLVEMVADYIIPKLTGNRILELGVGDQVWTPKLLERFVDVTSIDGSAELLAAMGSRLAGKKWTPVQTYFEDFESERGFDTVLITYVLEHVDDPSLILNRARRLWLRPRGRLAVVVPHALSLHRRLAVRMGLASYCGELGETDKRMGHKRCLTWHEMEKLIVDAGFRILERRGMITKVLPNSMLVHCSDEQLRGLFDLGLELPMDYAAAVFFLAEARPL